MKKRDHEHQALIMDLSALVQNSSGGLNDELAVLSPSGELVFKRAFGDKTIFKTAVGSVIVAFVFDPELPFDSSFLLASITTDYMAEMKYQLTKHLVGKPEMAPRAPSLEEVVWSAFKKNIPPEAFAKGLLADKKELETYLGVLKSRVEASFNEDQKLTKAITTKPFKFVFKIAIDSYTSKLRSTDLKLQQKRGVLSFVIEGKTKESETSSDEKQNETKSGASADAQDKGKKKRPLAKIEQEDGGTNGKKKKKKGSRSAQKLSLGELYKTLKMVPEDLEIGHVVSVKDFPESATEFFDQVGAWFSSVVSSKQQQLDQAAKPGMYQ